MPLLPSGRHVALDAVPLRALVATLTDDPYALHASDYKTSRDMLPWIRVMNLLPAEGDEVPSFKLAPGGAEIAKNLVPHDSGLCLGDWPEKFQAWSAEDQVAFQEFLDGRAQNFISSCQAHVLDEIRLHRTAFRSCLEAAWLEHGIHPDQEFGPDAISESHSLDSYDALVALGQCAKLLLPGEVHDRLRTPHGIAGRMLAVLAWREILVLLPWLPGDLPPLASTLTAAAQLRQQGKLQALPEHERTRWRKYLTSQCEILYDSGELEGVLMPTAPRAWSVICAVAAQVSLADVETRNASPAVPP